MAGVKSAADVNAPTKAAEAATFYRKRQSSKTIAYY